MQGWGAAASSSTPSTHRLERAFSGVGVRVEPARARHVMHVMGTKGRVRVNGTVVLRRVYPAVVVMQMLLLHHYLNWSPIRRRSALHCRHPTAKDTRSTPARRQAAQAKP